VWYSALLALLQTADATIIVVGLDQSQESEGHDRTIISLPGVQARLSFLLLSHVI
jgi:hypothetical protein